MSTAANTGSAGAIIIHSSRRLDEFWKYRLNQRAARNETLALTA